MHGLSCRMCAALAVLHTLVAQGQLGKVHTSCWLKVSVGTVSTLSWTENALTGICGASSCVGRSRATSASDWISAG